MTQITLEKANEFLKALDIAFDITLNSTIDAKSKDDILYYIEYDREEILKSLEKEDLDSVALKSYTNTFFVRWNEGVDIETELFWLKIEENNLNFQRKEPLRFALEKGRFLDVHKGMAARRNWNSLIEGRYLENRYTQEEIEKLFEIISNDENRRAEFLRNCLNLNRIPQTHYLKFGDCMAYMRNTGVFGIHFTKTEIEQLYLIWKNFKSK